MSKTTIEMAREAGVEFTYDPTETPTKTFVECWMEELERFTELVRADEREAIQDEFWMSLQSDLENGVKSLNEKAAAEYHKNYPGLVGFSKWLNERGEA